MLAKLIDLTVNTATETLKAAGHMAMDLVDAIEEKDINKVGDAAKRPIDLAINRFKDTTATATSIIADLRKTTVISDLRRRLLGSR